MNIGVVDVACCASHNVEVWPLHDLALGSNRQSRFCQDLSLSLPLSPQALSLSLFLSKLSLSPTIFPSSSSLSLSSQALHLSHLLPKLSLPPSFFPSSHSLPLFSQALPPSLFLPKLSLFLPKLSLSPTFFPSSHSSLSSQALPPSLFLSKLQHSADQMTCYSIVNDATNFTQRNQKDAEQPLLTGHLHGHISFLEYPLLHPVDSKWPCDFWAPGDTREHLANSQCQTGCHCHRKWTWCFHAEWLQRQDTRNSTHIWINGE